MKGCALPLILLLAILSSSLAESNDETQDLQSNKEELLTNPTGTSDINPTNTSKPTKNPHLPTGSSSTSTHTSPSGSTPTSPRTSPNSSTPTTPHTRSTSISTPTSSRTSTSSSTPTSRRTTTSSSTANTSHTSTSNSTPTSTHTSTSSSSTPTSSHTSTGSTTLTSTRYTSTSSSPTSPHTSTSSTFSTTPTPIPTSASTPSSCGFVPDCPLRGTKYIANPCPQSCQKFFVCYEGNWTAKACLPWENFNPQRLSCDWWWNVDCSWLQPTTPSQELTTFPDLTTPVPLTPRPPCTFIPKCPSSGTVKMADPCNCQKFYDCTAGKLESKACLPWENFEPNKLECVFMLDVDCNWPYYDPTTTPQPTTSKPTPTTDPTPSPTKPTETTPTSTTPTSTSKPTQTPTNPTSTSTSKPTSAPTKPTQSPTTTPRPTTTDPNICTFKPQCPAVGKELVPIPCKDYCQKYYECTNGKAELKTCSKVLFVSRNFHPVNKQCQLTGVNCDWYKDPKPTSIY